MKSRPKLETAKKEQSAKTMPKWSVRPRVRAVLITYKDGYP